MKFVSSSLTRLPSLKQHALHSGAASRFEVRGSRSEVRHSSLTLLPSSLILLITLTAALLTSGARAQTNADRRELLGPSSRKTPIVITEIMYKPAPRADTNNLEYIEI